MTPQDFPRTIAAAAALALLLSGASLAQTTEGETEGGSSAETGAQTGAAATEDTSSQGGGEDTQTSGDQTTPPAAPLPSAEAVLATVGDQKVTLADVIAVRQALPEQYQQLPDEVLMTGIVEQIVEQILLETAAKASGLADTPLIQKAIRSQTRAVLADAYMSEALQDAITEEKIAETYQTRFVEADPVVEVRAAHILVREEAQAAEIKAKIDAGADFAAMAAEHGTDGTAARGGDLGWFVRAQMVPEFADAAFALEPGQISGPVETPFGWHLIKLEEKRDQPAPPLEEVQSSIIEELSQEISTEVLDELRADAAITRFLDGIDAAAIRADDLISE